MYTCVQVNCIIIYCLNQNDYVLITLNGKTLNSHCCYVLSHSKWIVVHDMFFISVLCVHFYVNMLTECRSITFFEALLADSGEL